MSDEIKIPAFPKVCRRCGTTANNLDEAITLFGKRRDTRSGQVDIQAWCRTCRYAKRKDCKRQVNTARRQAAVEAWQKKKREAPLQGELDL